MLDEWFNAQIASKNFSAIHSQVVKANSGSMRSEMISAVYAAFDAPGGDRDFCLRILQKMEDAGWQWSSKRDDIHRLLPLHCVLERLSVPDAERNRYYDSVVCVESALTWGGIMTTDSLVACCENAKISVGGPI